jgi:hypothetical protein
LLQKDKLWFFCVCYTQNMEFFYTFSFIGYCITIFTCH